jgi:Holliday junction resolvase RusA-like endonuclease
MVFEVLGKPQGKARPRFTRGGHTYTPTATALYEKAVTRAFLQAKGVILDGEVRAVITAYYPIPKSTSKKKKDEMLSGIVRPTKKPDCDNIAKIILDALNKVAYKDDSQVVELVVNKMYGDTAKVVVKLEEVRTSDNGRKV